MSLLQIAARVAGRRYADVPAAPMPETSQEQQQAAPGGEGDMSFSGKVSQRFDGENCSAEGQLTIDGKVHEFSCGTSGRDPAQCKLDGQDLPDTDPLHERIELFMTDIWPQEDGNWDAVVENNVTHQAPTPVQDE